MAWWIFQNLVVTAALAALVLVVCRATRIGPVARHALWVIVLVKFVTPPIVSWPWAVPDPFGVAALDARESRPSVIITDASLDPATGALVVGPAAELRDREGAGATGAGSATSSLTAAAVPWLLGLWAAGSMFRLGLEGVRLARLRRRTRYAPPVDPAIVRRAAELSVRLGLRPVDVIGIAGQSSPAVWGAGRPRLLWPSDLTAQATDTSIDGLLVHELAHIRRGDHLVGWIELAAGIVWWWNPLFWYVRSALREQAELACDAWVISALPDGRRAYAESLLMLSGAGMGRQSPVAVVGMGATSRRMLERRLVMIMQGRAPLRLTWVGMCCLGLVTAATLPAWATSSEQTPVQTTVQAPTPKTQTQVEVKPVVVAPKVAVTVTPVPVQEKRVVVTPEARRDLSTRLRTRPELPADGQELLKGYDADYAAIFDELEKKIAARRDTLAAALKSLQDSYTKAGKLDEAVAIRDFIQAGMPGLDTGSGYFRFIRRK